jgi:activator of HSP90 ATPase
MPKTISQKVVFKNTTPKELYELYMDAKLHSALCGSEAKISKKEGAPFSAHGKYISGKNLHLVPNKFIVQTWRAVDWHKDELDSIFSIQLEAKGKDVILHAVHSNVPDKAAAGIDKGWHDHYWKPWKQHLAGKKITRPKM